MREGKAQNLKFIPFKYESGQDPDWENGDLGQI
jgi:hypothetical protein